ncbi:MAG: 2-amino-4-hydroxy-6-hydroxymethyldihydropteridine diphosphokinase [Chitinivorax sp.]
MSLATHRAYIGLGSNLEQPQQQVSAAMLALGDMPQTRLLVRSSLYHSAPVGYADQPDFVNAAALIETALAPQALLQALLVLEQQFGRVRTFLNAPRTLDLDILLYDDLLIADTNLVVPHPRMHERAFVLLPLAELAADLQIPGKGPISEWLHRCGDQSVQRLN